MQKGKIFIGVTGAGDCSDDAYKFLLPPGPYRMTENSNCVILNGAKRSEDSWFYVGWEARFFALTGSE